MWAFCMCMHRGRALFIVLSKGLVETAQNWILERSWGRHKARHVTVTHLCGNRTWSCFNLASRASALALCHPSPYYTNSGAPPIFPLYQQQCTTHLLTITTVVDCGHRNYSPFCREPRVVNGSPLKVSQCLRFTTAKNNACLSAFLACLTSFSLLCVAVFCLPLVPLGLFWSQSSSSKEWCGINCGPGLPLWLREQCCTLLWPSCLSWLQTFLLSFSAFQFWRQKRWVQRSTRCRRKWWCWRRHIVRSTGTTGSRSGSVWLSATAILALWRHN